MNIKTATVIGFLFILAVLLGFNYFFKPFAADPNQQAAQTDPSPAPSPAVPAEEALFQSLSPEERVAQLLAAPVNLPLDTASPSAEVGWVGQRQPGLVTIFGDQVATDEAEVAIRSLKQSSQRVRLLVAVDHEGGSVQRLSGEGFSLLPSWRQACQGITEESQELFSQSARELSQVGVNIVLAPMLDFGSPNPVLQQRICSDDPELVVENALLFAAAFYQQGVLPVFKHFPGIGQTTRDLHTSFDRVTVEPESAGLYRQALDVFPDAGVMVSHVGVENQFPDVPCSLSGACVGQLTSNYPQTLIFTDALEMESAGYVATGSAKSLSQRSIDAVSAGNDVLVFGPTVTAEQLETVYQALLTEYQQNNTFQTLVDRAAFAIVQRKYRE
jgi:beta-N-acetylhexosaminidase